MNTLQGFSCKPHENPMPSLSILQMSKTETQRGKVTYLIQDTEHTASLVNNGEGLNDRALDPKEEAKTLWQMAPPVSLSRMGLGY